MYSTSNSRDVPMFSIVTVVVKYRSFTPNDVDADIFRGPFDPTHVDDSRPGVDVSITDVGVMPAWFTRPLLMYLGVDMHTMRCSHGQSLRRSSRSRQMQTAHSTTAAQSVMARSRGVT
jgi:hypothetical protein